MKKTLIYSIFLVSCSYFVQISTSDKLPGYTRATTASENYRTTSIKKIHTNKENSQPQIRTYGNNSYNIKADEKSLQINRKNHFSLSKKTSIFRLVLPKKDQENIAFQPTVNNTENQEFMPLSPKWSDNDPEISPSEVRRKNALKISGDVKTYKPFSKDILHEKSLNGYSEFINSNELASLLTQWHNRQS